MSRTDRWTLVLSRNDSDGAPPVEEVSALYHPSYEAAVRVAFLRRDPWRKTWQERLKERVHHLPWDEWAPWWIVEDPQVAWDHAPEGNVLLWVLSRDELRHVQEVYRVLALRVLSELGPTTLPRDERALYDALVAGREEEDASRTALSLLLDRTPEDPPARGSFEAWARRRMVVVTLLAVYGARERAYEIGWLGEQIGLWTQERLAALLRGVFPEERFTWPLPPGA